MKAPLTIATPFSFILKLWTGIALLMLFATASCASSGYKGEFIPFPQVTLHSDFVDVPHQRRLHWPDPVTITMRPV